MVCRVTPYSRARVVLGSPAADRAWGSRRTTVLTKATPRSLNQGVVLGVHGSGCPLVWGAAAVLRCPGVSRRWR